MSQFVRIKTTVYHVPSIARLSLTDSAVLGRPIIIIQDHSANISRINYGISQWKNAEFDFLRVQRSITACRDALKDVPSIEETVQEKKELA